MGLKDKEDVVEQIGKEIEEHERELLESKGFLTKKDAFLDRAEWHAAVLGFTPIGTGYILPSPIGELFVVAELLMLRTGFNKKMRGEKVDGHLGDVIDEVAYTFAFTFVAALIFELVSLRYGFTGLTSLDLGQLIIMMLGGA